MSKNIIGLVLIDAPHSALNNAGTQAGQATENIVVVKTMRKGSQIYPYVSGQAWRNWWRTTLGSEFGWSLSPIEREAKIAFTAASPAEYDDDDVFGYMKAPKGKSGETVTRLSPLKCSPLISIAPHRPTDDFGVMSRHEGDPVPYEYQFYSCILKGIFSLDLDAVGVFWSINRTGFKNITDAYIPIIQSKGGKLGRTLTNESEEQQDILGDKNSPWVLPQEVRLRRARQVIEALAVLSGGAKLTSHLTDVTPKLIVLAVIDGGNHPFMNLIVETDGDAKFSIPALRQAILDYSDRILSGVYIGRREGFMDELDPQLKEFANDFSFNKKIILGSPNQVIKQIADNLDKYIGD
ncbi:MAG: type I-B CRISPR-associated protein Cas7/Cst2/DevR [bacterium]